MTDILVKKLTEGLHRVVMGYKEESMQELNERLQDGYIHLKFPDTRGETELGITIDKLHSSIDNFLEQDNLHIEGKVTLNSHKVKCIADISTKTREGKGNLILESI